MSFIQFGYVIAGAAAMTLPIWIHLLLRQRSRPMEIGSIRFLKHVVRKSKSRQRIQRWLLLALRAAAMLLLGLLFARPFLPDTPIDGRTREAAVLIDRSASMSAEHEGGRTAMASAVERARQFIATQGDRATVHIGLFDASGVETISLEQLGQAKVASTATGYQDAFDWLSDVAASSGRRDKSILLLSDLQRRGLKPTDSLLLPPEVSVTIEDPAPVITQNLAVESVVPTQVELRPGVPVAIAVRIYNSGAFPIAKVPLAIQLQGPGRPLELAQTLSIAAGQRQTLDVELPISEPGVYRGEVWAERDDPLPHDDRRYIAFEVRHPDRVLLVEGDPGRHPWENESYFLETALRLRTPVGDGPPRTFEVEELIWDQGSGFPDLAGFRLIVLANLGRFRATDAQRLREFVDAGGNAIWFTGSRTSSAVMETLIESGLLGNITVGEPYDTIARITEFDANHPALFPFGNPQHGNLRALQVRRLVPVNPRSPTTSVLVRSRELPLVIAHPTGKGQTVLIPTSADRSWSDWPQHRLFVPLVRQLAAWLTGRLDAQQSVVHEIIGNPADLPGITQSDGATVVRNVSSDESDTGRFGVDQFREAIGLAEQDADPIQVIESKSLIPAGVSRPDEKWPILVWALLGLLAVEFLLASRVHE